MSYNNHNETYQFDWFGCFLFTIAYNIWGFQDALQMIGAYAILTVI